MGTQKKNIFKQGFVCKQIMLGAFFLIQNWGFSKLLKRSFKRVGLYLSLT